MLKRLGFMETPRGIMATLWTTQGLYELTFPCSSFEEATAHLTSPDGVGGDLNEQQHAWTRLLLSELKVYFSGEPIAFSVPIDWRDYSLFRRKALKFTAAIPHGQIATYGGIAAAIGHPGAARAVGGAMHANRTPIVVPCHRVVGADGTLTGFGGGLTLKQELLELEKKYKG